MLSLYAFVGPFTPSGHSLPQGVRAYESKKRKHGLRSPKRPGRTRSKSFWSANAMLSLLPFVEPFTLGGYSLPRAIAS